MVIAFCGLGLMGSQMAGRLRAASHELRVWNRTPEKARGWAARGGVACDSPAQAARGAAEAHFMLADDAAVEFALDGPDGVLATLARGALVVDHSTVSVAGTKARAARITGLGWRYLHAPVLAGPANIGEGRGLMIVGGGQRTYETALPVLKQLLEDHFRAGEQPHEAAAFKLMANSMLVSIVEGLAEYFAIAKGSGISAARAMDLFESFDPCGTIARRGPRMAAGNYEPTFTLGMGLKDVRLMLEAAGANGSLPALKVTFEKMQSLVDRGLGGLDLGAVSVDVIPDRSKT